MMHPMMISHHEFWLWTYGAPFEVFHERGRLVIESDRFHTGFEAAEVVRTPGYSDTIRFQRRLVDRDGILHIADSWISTEDIWDMVAGRVVAVPHPEKLWRPLPEYYGELRDFVDGVSLENDSRQERVFVGCWTDDNQTTRQSVRLARNKHFHAKLEMRIGLRKDAQGRLESGKIVAAFTKHSQTQELAEDGSSFVDPESSDAEPPIRFDFPVSTLYWHDGLRRVVSDDLHTDWHCSPRLPVCFRATERGGGTLAPNEGVYLKTD